ncbi:MFS transporter [Alicyclobacillus acidoterrestris]|uniref:MFS transporter n=1 Tax=Alicyclobacillus suci TaxID=2816080 RepID=UPI00119739F5|nr:MFS transporter [Alicyclobacillus suci]GEO27303.1 MFS transporter [Alicyclobacillus acidoterrestris]
MSTHVQSSREREILGMPTSLFWGFVAVFLFMVGDGVEQAFLSKYMVQLGFSLNQSAMVFSIYGVTLAIASWLSGVLAEVWGPRRAMILGFIIWVVFDIGFLYFGLDHKNYAMMLIMYGLRGFGYPLFSFSFIVWISYVSKTDKLGSAMGWFWLVFAGGLGFIGSYYPSFTIPLFGFMGTLWSALVWIIVGGLMGILLIREKGDRRESVSNKSVSESSHSVRGLMKGITIVFENPRIGMGGIVRVINTSAQYGFVVVLPIFFTQTLHFSTSQWLQIWGDMSISNMIFNLIWGMIGDKIGWRTQVKWFGGVGCALTSLFFYYGPLAAGHNYWVAVLASVLFGITLAGFVPLSAIMPSLAPDHKGAAMSVLNLGAGLSTFVGPAIVGLLNDSFGLKGIVWTFAVLYIISAVLTHFLEVQNTTKTSRQLGEVGTDSTSGNI